MACECWCVSVVLFDTMPVYCPSYFLCLLLFLHMWICLCMCVGVGGRVCVREKKREAEQVQELSCHFPDLCLIGALAVYQETYVCVCFSLSGHSWYSLLRQMHRWWIIKQWSNESATGFFSTESQVSGFEFEFQHFEGGSNVSKVRTY